MSRLLHASLVLFASGSPAMAEVCDKVLGEDFDRLINASLWHQVGDRLFAPATIVLLAIAVLTATKMPGLRGIALIAGLVTAVQAVTAIGANVFPDAALIAARIEGCGGASIATAIVSSALAILLAISFVVAVDGTPRPRD
ncbi:hypothetical protein [Microvirga brassicacearum]|uniref:Uncharacterized protein n=1 Tax=Microvirga brassicacearum TaxID=2580413 RepID=A0A5N3PFA5_9HYPH|nr:hypothetical protein [Microvirga brassicacearum]KAB0268399.1 hypothetical protein FEZ63_05230 [Microvirga brassicacearum]